jgi:hypothetical protein
LGGGEGENAVAVLMPKLGESAFLEESMHKYDFILAEI